jgi:hypothetical protein
MSNIKVGDTVYYDGVPSTVTGLSPGEYGERVTFNCNGSTITTTPGLDHRFSLSEPDGTVVPSLSELMWSRPPPGSWADVARMMASTGGDEGIDWDAWKDEMKETDGKGY